MVVLARIQYSIQLFAQDEENNDRKKIEIEATKIKNIFTCMIDMSPVISERTEFVVSPNVKLQRALLIFLF